MKKFELPIWVHQLGKIIKASDFQRTERYGESWHKWETAPLIDAAMEGDADLIFLQLGYLEGRVARLKALLEEAGIEVPENEAKTFVRKI